MSKAVECPHCGFMNLHGGRECARCRKPLPEAPPSLFDGDAEPDDEQSSSLVDMSGTDTHETLPPPLKEREEKKEPEAAPDTEESRTEKMGIEPPQEAAADVTPEFEEQEIDDSRADNAPLFDEESLTYTGSDAELRELSRFFREARKSNEAAQETPAEEPPSASEEYPLEDATQEEQRENSISRVEIDSPRGARDSSDSFKPFFKNSYLPGFGEESASSKSGATGSTEVERVPMRKPATAAQVPLLSRALSGAVDILMYASIFFILYFGAQLADVSAVKWFGGAERPELNTIQWMIKVILPLAIMMAVIFLFSETFFAVTSGQTPGQMIFKLRTADQTGVDVTFPQALVRTVIYLALLLPLGMGLVTIILGSENRGAHEQFSGTRTMKANQGS